MSDHQVSNSGKGFPGFGGARQNRRGDRVFNRMVAVGAVIMPATIALPAVMVYSNAAPVTVSPEPRLQVDAALRQRQQPFSTQLPLAFERNDGQTAAEVDFLARGRDYALFLTATETVLNLTSGDDPALDGEGLVLRMRWVGGQAAELSGERKLPGVVNHFIGDDPAGWRTGIPTFARVRAAHVYPGVDMMLYGSRGHLKYDLVMAPGVDPGVLRLKLSGVENVEVDDQGRLTLFTGQEPIHQAAPATWQYVGEQRRHLEARFVRLSHDEVGVTFAGVDPSLPLVMSASLNYSSYLGGKDQDSAAAIAVDASGNSYVAGQTASADFPMNSGGYDRSFNGSSSDAVVTRLSSSGAAVVYSTYLGGSTGGTGGYVGWDTARGIAVDSAGGAYVVGYTYASNFPVSSNAVQKKFAGANSDLFVTRLSPSGDSLAWSTYLGGNDSDAGEAIAIDPAGNAYVTGYSYSNNYPVTTGAVQTTNRGWADAIVTKLSSNGSNLVFSTYLGGTAGSGGSYGDFGKGIAVDPKGGVYVTGHTLSTDFPTTSSAYQSTRKGSYDGFFTRLNPSGSALTYSTYLGGTGQETMGGISIGPDGDAYLVGTTTSIDHPVTAGVIQPKAGGGTYDVFVARLCPEVAGNGSLVFSTYLGGNNQDFGRGIRIDRNGDVVLAGYTRSTNFPVSQDALQGTFGGGDYDAFGARISGSGGALRYSTYLGGNGYDCGTAVAVDGKGSLYLTGSTLSTNFTTTSGAIQTGMAGSGKSDAFVTRITF